MTSTEVQVYVATDSAKLTEQLSKLKEQVKSMCDENLKLRAENNILREQVARFHPSHTVQLDGNIDQW